MSNGFPPPQGSPGYPPEQQPPPPQQPPPAGYQPVPPTPPPGPVQPGGSPAGSGQGASVAGLLLGIVGVLFGLPGASVDMLPYIPQLLGAFLAFALGGTAVALGFTGRKRARAISSSSGAATAGLVVGFVAIGLAVIGGVTAVVRMVGEYAS